MGFGRDVLVNVVGSVIATVIAIYIVKTFWPEVAKVLP